MSEEGPCRFPPVAWLNCAPAPSRIPEGWRRLHASRVTWDCSSQTVRLSPKPAMRERIVCWSNSDQFPAQRIVTGGTRPKNTPVVRVRRLGDDRSAPEVPCAVGDSTDPSTVDLVFAELQIAFRDDDVWSRLPVCDDPSDRTSIHQLPIPRDVQSLELAVHLPTVEEQLPGSHHDGDEGRDLEDQAPHIEVHRSPCLISQPVVTVVRGDGQRSPDPTAPARRFRSALRSPSSNRRTGACRGSLAELQPRSA